VAHVAATAGTLSLMLQFIVLIVIGFAGAGAGWIAGSVLSANTGITATLASIPLAGQLVASIGLREICAGAGLLAFIFLAVLFGRGRAMRWSGGRGVLAALAAGGILFGASEAGGVFFDSIGMNPLAPDFEFEIRLPAGSKVPTARDDIQIELHTDRNQIIASVRDVGRDGERPVLYGVAPLKFRTTERRIVMLLAGEPVRVFRVRLPARPAPSAGYGPWQQVDFIEDARRESRRAEVTADYAIRYRVR
jgi:hypothetical protein